MVSKPEQPRPRVETQEVRREASEAIVLETLDNIDRQVDETMNRLSDLESLPLNSDDVLSAVEADQEVGLSAKAQKFANRLEEASTILRAEIFEVLAPDETTPWDPVEEMKALKLKLREIRKNVTSSKLTAEDGRSKERRLVELYKLEFIHQQEAIRELQETLINAAGDSLITASGLTLRELDEACKSQERADELMKKAGTNNLADLFAIREDKVDYDQLMKILETGASKARLTSKQTGLFRQGLDRMYARHDRARKLVKKYGHSKELAAIIFGMKPEEVGEVEVLQGFGTLYFRFHKLESFARFATSKFDPKIELTNQEIDKVRRAGGIAKGRAPEGFEELTGGLIAENANGRSYNLDSHVIKLHEAQHALHRVYPPLDLSKSRLIVQAIDENVKEKPNLDFIAGGIQGGARNERIDEIDPRTHDEILAFFTEGGSPSKIYDYLTTSSLYDYYAEDKEGYQNTGSTLTSLGEDFRKQLIDRIFRDEYYGEIYRALRVIERMQGLGMKNLEIRAALLTVPLTKWPTFLRRLMEQRFPETRKAPDYNSLGNQLEKVRNKIEQDVVYLQSQSKDREALKANLQLVKKVDEAVRFLREGKIEGCIEILEEAVGDKDGGRSGVLGWEGARDMIHELYDVLDNRPNLAAYGFETEEMTREQAIGTILDSLSSSSNFGDDEWWQLQKVGEMVLHANYEEASDDAKSMAETGLASVIKAKKAGKENDQMLRRLRSALRAL